MAKNLEAHRHYENLSVDTRSELSNLNQEVRENNDRISEKEKEEYKRLNVQFDHLITQAKVFVLSNEDKKYFEQKGMPYIYVDTVTTLGGNSLAVHSKSNEYKPLWLRKNDITKGKRPDIFLNDLLRGGRDKKQLSVEQYNEMIEKIGNILRNQEKFLYEKRKESKNKKDKEIKDIINNL